MIGVIIAVVSFGIIVGIITLLASRLKDNGTFLVLEKVPKNWIPVTIVIDQDTLWRSSARILCLLNEAESFWNATIGLNLFDNSCKGAIVPIYSKLDSDTDRAVATTILKLREKTVVEAKILIEEGKFFAMTDYIAKRCLAHELGHILGLEHDEKPNSVMHGKPGNLGLPYIITDKDVKLIQSLYKEG